VQQSSEPKLSRRRYASVSYALQNNTVFRRAQNWVSVSDGSRIDNGSEFQRVGPETAKHLWPYLLFLSAELQGHPAQVDTVSTVTGTDLSWNLSTDRKTRHGLVDRQFDSKPHALWRWKQHVRVSTVKRHSTITISQLLSIFLWKIFLIPPGSKDPGS